MQQSPMDCNFMGNLNFPNPAQGPTTMWAPIQTENSTSQSTMIPTSQSAVYWNHYMNFVRNPLGLAGLKACAGQAKHAKNYFQFSFLVFSKSFSKFRIYIHKYIDIFKKLG
jgi:hypothetical protein